MIGNSTASDGLDARRRRIQFRVRRRGLYELDVLLGAFADARLAALPGEDLDRFEELLDLPDQELLRWITGGGPVPAAYRSSLFDALIAFHRQM
ncbi:MAG: FAD assembly factor SdhE [Bauldia sp.]